MTFPAILLSENLIWVGPRHAVPEFYPCRPEQVDVDSDRTTLSARRAGDDLFLAHTVVCTSQRSTQTVRRYQAYDEGIPRDRRQLRIRAHSNACAHLVRRSRC